MKSICVFCGSSKGNNPNFAQAAKNLGHTLVKHKFRLIYGGASIGLMGILADAVIEAGGEVIGVMPEALAKREIAHKNLFKLYIVNSMHERKALMSKLADGFVALPGGLGTIEEFFEVLTWAQLGIHNKPCGVLNINKYYNQLFNFLRHAVDVKILKKEYLSMIIADESPENIINKFKLYHPPKIKKWIDITET